jgi:small subunit ribosomal protein S8
MSMTDPLADMFARIRNGQTAGKTAVTMPSSKLKVSVCHVLKKEGYIEDFVLNDMGSKTELRITLKYYKGRPVIDQLRRVSKPGCRVYQSRDRLPSVLGGWGVAIMSTSNGLMSDREAREQGLGGEVLCVVS